MKRNTKKLLALGVTMAAAEVMLAAGGGGSSDKKTSAENENASI